MHIAANGVSQVAAGPYRAAAVTANHTLLTWGSEPTIFGFGSRTPQPTSLPNQFGSTSGAVYVSLSGTAHYLAVSISSDAVPSIIGLTTAAANAAIHAAGLTSFGGTPVFNCEQEGKVLSQSPGAGSQVGSGTSVSFTIGSRRDPRNPRRVCQ